MPSKKPREDAAEPREPKLSMHTLTLTPAQMEIVRAYCDGQMWETFAPDYSIFGFKHKGRQVNVVGYKSGKLVVSGKGTQDFVRDFIEPEVTGEARLGYDEVHHPEWFEPHAGLDEAGKGDLFGPVVAATVVADGAAVRAWLKAGVRDSKTLSDPSILRLEALIRGTANVAVQHAWCGMEKYNGLMAKPRANLNTLLAWLHARALQGALAKQSAPWGLLDQFSTSPLVQRQLKKDGFDFDLRMRTGGESDPIVAAASICARAEFVRQIDALSEIAGEKLLKGASAAVKAQASRLVEKRGSDFLGQVAKLHFRTAKEVLGLPVEPKVPWRRREG